jgi:hypothetical protein
MHYLGILLAAAVMFGLGSVWYSPVLFSRVWAREAGIDPNQKPDSKAMARIFGGTFVLLLVCATVLDILISNSTAGEGILHGLFMGFLGGVIASAITAINHLFEKKSLKLFLINAGYDVIGFCLMGVILAML